MAERAWYCWGKLRIDCNFIGVVVVGCVWSWGVERENIYSKFRFALVFV